MVKLTSVFNKILPQKILVVGDLILDTYTLGKVGRISPEAPVPVLHVDKENHLPGGSGNVALNLISLGSQVVALGRVGHDKNGELLKEALREDGVDISAIVVQGLFPTPVKNRIIAGGQQIVRIDREITTALPEMLEQQIIDNLPLLLKGVKIIALSDYGKGFLTRTLLRAIIDLARELNIPVIADPKGIDFSKYRGATVIKPNLGEAYAAANLLHGTPLELVAERLLEVTEAETLMITRSEAGISLFHQGGKEEHFPVKVREVKDVTGAGDTVLATLACSLANGLSLSESVQLSNVTAGLAVERFGCARITLSELARTLLQDHIENKVFDEDHLFILSQALKGKQYNILGISGKEGLTSSIYNAIRSIKKEHHDLLIYVESAEAEFIDILASLHEVDFIIVQNSSLQNLCTHISPNEIYRLEGTSLKPIDNITSIV